MNMKTHSIEHYFARYPAAPAAIYISLVLGLFFVALLFVGNLAEQYSELRSVAERASHQQHGSASLLITGAPTGSVPQGSPFLGGQSVTIANAALLQRVVGAITHAGGTVSSSNIGQKSQRSDDRLVRVVANCELDQGALQQLLYDLEAGMPFLFVDQLVVTGPLAEGERMHVQLGVSGLWLDEKN